MNSCHIINMKLVSYFQKEFHQIITYQDLFMFYWDYKNAVDQLGLLLSTWRFSSSNPISRRIKKCWRRSTEHRKMFLVKHFQAFRSQRSHWCQICLLNNVSHRFSPCFSDWCGQAMPVALSSQRAPSQVYFPHLSSSWCLLEVFPAWGPSGAAASKVWCPWSGVSEVFVVVLISPNIKVELRPL